MVNVCQFCCLVVHELEVVAESAVSLSADILIVKLRKGQVCRIPLLLPFVLIWSSHSQIVPRK